MGVWKHLKTKRWRKQK